jgi:hypothetical protein
VLTMRGASVVTAGGVPTLRAYGLTPSGTRWAAAHGGRVDGT